MNSLTIYLKLYVIYRDEYAIMSEREPNGGKERTQPTETIMVTMETTERTASGSNPTCAK
jgi:hypothetical protein